LHPTPSSADFAAIKPPTVLWQLGAYFGHSVLGVDLNGDGYDDLLVSAPLFSDKLGYDQGRVFVFMNNPSYPGSMAWVRQLRHPITAVW